MRFLVPLLAFAFLALLPAVSAELRVLVMSPDGGELWWGYRTIQWSGACDPPDNVTYRIEISVDGGSSWGYVDEKSFWEESVPAPHEVGFNTAGIEKSTRCLVRVSAKAQTWGFENSDTSDNFFTIQNLLPPPRPVSPANAATIANRTPTLTWMDEECPWEIENHLVQISIDPNFTPGRIVWSLPTGKLTSATVYTVLSDGVYYWRVRCVDERGVESDWSETFSFEVFTYAPILTSVTPSKFFVNTRKVDLNIEASNIIYLQYSLDGGASWSDWEYYTSPFEIKFSENELDGEKMIWLRGKSQGGKLSDIKTVKVCLDTRIPLVTPEFSGVLGEGGAYKGSVTIILRCLDFTSGVDLVSYRVDDDPPENGDTFTIAADGTHTVEYTVRDRAGNVARGSFTVSVYTPLSPVPYMAFFGGTVGVAVFWVFMWKKGIPAIAAWRKQRQLRSRWFQELVGWAGETGEASEETEAVEAPKLPRTSSIVQSYKEMLVPAAEMLREKRAESAVERLPRERASSLDDLISQLDEIKKKSVRSR